MRIELLMGMRLGIPGYTGYWPQLSALPIIHIGLFDVGAFDEDQTGGRQWATIGANKRSSSPPGPPAYIVSKD